jgi:hypothetical protein
MEVGTLKEVAGNSEREREKPTRERKRGIGVLVFYDQSQSIA